MSAGVQSFGATRSVSFILVKTLLALFAPRGFFGTVVLCPGQDIA